MNGMPMLRTSALAEVASAGGSEPVWVAYWPMSVHTMWYDSFFVAIVLIAGLTLALLSVWTKISKPYRLAMGMVSISLTLPALAYVSTVRPWMVDGAVVLKQDRLVAMQRDMAGNRYIRTILFSDIVNATVVEDPTGNVLAAFKACGPQPRAEFVFMPPSTGRALADAMRTTDIRQHQAERACEVKGLPI